MAPPADFSTPLQLLQTNALVPQRAEVLGQVTCSDDEELEEDGSEGGELVAPDGSSPGELRGVCGEDVGGWKWRRRWQLQQLELEQKNQKNTSARQHGARTGSRACSGTGARVMHQLWT